MSTRSTSFSAALGPGSGHARRPSVASRLSQAVSTSAAERGQAHHAAAGEQRIEEEIAEIKRYEVRVAKLLLLVG